MHSPTEGRPPSRRNLVPQPLGLRPTDTTCSGGCPMQDHAFWGHLVSGHWSGKRSTEFQLCPLPSGTSEGHPVSRDPLLDGEGFAQLASQLQLLSLHPILQFLFPFMGIHPIDILLNSLSASASGLPSLGHSTLLCFCSVCFLWRLATVSKNDPV